MPGKVALVTGGTRGIGYAIAARLTAEGYDLAVNGRRGEDRLGEELASLRAHGTKVIYCQADIGDAIARQEMLTEIEAQFGALHVLVNNAGMAPRVRSDVLEATEDCFEEVMRVNLQGPYFLTQAVSNWMIRQYRADSDFSGCIINVGSVSATVASPSRGEYCLSKAGVAMATQLWAVRLAEFGIPVYEIRPGIIRTDMTAEVTGKYDRLIAGGLLLQARWGLPEDVAKAVAMLARGELPYSTGQVIMVDGGQTRQRL